MENALWASGPWVAQLVERLTLGLAQVHDLRIVILSFVSVCMLSVESA